MTDSTGGWSDFVRRDDQRRGGRERSMSAADRGLMGCSGRSAPMKDVSQMGYADFM